jgi:AraC-like DNA-binding protein
MAKFYLQSKSQSGKAVIQPKIYNRLLRARSYIQKTTSSLCLNEIAAQANLSPFHFHRTYKQAFNETPHNHHNRLRLARAKILLRNGEFNVTDVCFEVGFESVSSFSGWFLRSVGLSPSLYQMYSKKRNVPPEMQSFFVPNCFLRLNIPKPEAQE